MYFSLLAETILTADLLIRLPYDILKEFKLVKMLGFYLLGFFLRTYM